MFDDSTYDDPTKGLRRSGSEHVCRGIVRRSDGSDTIEDFEMSGHIDDPDKSDGIDTPEVIEANLIGADFIEVNLVEPPMPSYRSITLSLISQYDILTIPEYAPLRASSGDPFVQSSNPVLIDAAKSLVSVYIPRYAGSQFWLRYSISPPHPPRALYYFKLFLNGTEIVSWGCGKEDEYKGKTMWALDDTGVRWMGERAIERRVLCFGPDEDAIVKPDKVEDDLAQVMEVRVYRAKGRKPYPLCAKEVREASARTRSERGIELVNAGHLAPQDSQTFYKYALLDPLDQPFATFRYYDRSWDQLETLGIVSSSTERGTNDSPDSHTFSSTSSPSLQAGTSRLEHPPQSSESLATALTPSPTGYDDLTHGSPTPAPRRPRTLPRSTTVSQRDPQRSVKRSASVGLLMEVVSHAVKWWERGDGSPVKRTPLKRALSANASAVHDGSAALTRPSNLR